MEPRCEDRRSLPRRRHAPHPAARRRSPPVTPAGYRAADRHGVAADAAAVTRIETPRLLLRAPAPVDAGALAALLTEDVSRWLANRLHSFSQNTARPPLARTEVPKPKGPGRMPEVKGRHGTTRQGRG